MIITTATHPDTGMLKTAERLAKELNAPYVPRRQYTLRALARRHGTKGVLVAGRDGLRYVTENQPPLFFHPGMGLIRIKRLLAGGTDALIAISGAAPGDSVLDCTAGLASDAIVFSFAVGSTGSVTAIEASPLLSVLIREGLQHAATGLPQADEACRRIRVVHGDHTDILRGMADKSVDIVYFDPMFEQPVATSDAIRPLRYHARHDPVSEEAVHHAVRVARKTVVMKNSAENAAFARLGFVPARESRSAVSYGVIHVASAKQE